MEAAVDLAPRKRARPTWLRGSSYRPPLGHLIVAGLIAVTGAGVWFYEEVVEERWVAKRLGVVEPGQVYRSGQLAAPIVEGVLEKLNIAVVVDLTAAEPVREAQVAEAEAIAAHGITRHRFPMQGNGVGTAESYAGAITEIHRAVEAGRPVLVHCEAGAQRTGGVVAGYRLLVQGKDSAQVYAEAERYGWEPDEDHAWPRFLNDHMEAIALRLVDAGVLEAVPDPLPIFAPW